MNHCGPTVGWTAAPRRVLEFDMELALADAPQLLDQLNRAQGVPARGDTPHV